MPLDEKDLEVIGSKFKELIEPVTKNLDEVGKLAKAAHEQFPGMSKKHAAEVREALEARLAELSTSPATKPAKTKTEDEPDKIAKLADDFKAELKKRDDALETERRVNAVASALQGVKFLSPKGFKFAQDELMGSLDRDESGNLIYKAKEKLAGAEVETRKPLADAVKEYLGANSWLIEGDPKGGVSAGSNAKGNDSGAARASWEHLPYEQIKAKGLLGIATATNSALLKKKHEEWLSKQGT